MHSSARFQQQCAEVSLHLHRCLVRPWWTEFDRNVPTLLETYGVSLSHFTETSVLFDGDSTSCSGPTRLQQKRFKKYNQPTFDERKNKTKPPFSHLFGDSHLFSFLIFIIGTGWCFTLQAQRQLCQIPCSRCSWVRLATGFRGRTGDEPMKKRQQPRHGKGENRFIWFIDELFRHWGGTENAN